MTDRLARVIEFASVIVIGACVLIFGWTMLRNAAHFGVASSIVLLLLGAFQIAALGRTLRSGQRDARLLVTRDCAFVAAIVFALFFVIAAQRWSIGACITSLEFGLVLELLARIAPVAPGEGR